MRRSWRYLLYIVVLVGYYIWLLLSPAVFFNSEKSSKKVIVTGHRGAAGYAPENTLASIQKAIDLGVDRIEIDIHQSKDSVIVVIHDDTVDRTTNGSGKVNELSYEELKKLDAGSFFSNEFSEEKIPTLEEVLQLVKGQKDLLIEFKYGNETYPGIEEAVLELLDKHQAVNWCIVHSFRTSVLESLHHLKPQLRLQKLFILQLRFTPFYYDTGFNSFDPNDYPYIQEYSLNEYFGNKEIIYRLQAMGKKVNVWTPNKTHRIDAYKALGIDGIITDYPDLIQ